MGWKVQQLLDNYTGHQQKEVQGFIILSTHWEIHSAEAKDAFKELLIHLKFSREFEFPVVVKTLFQELHIESVAWKSMLKTGLKYHNQNISYSSSESLSWSILTIKQL